MARKLAAKIAAIVIKCIIWLIIVKKFTWKGPIYVLLVKGQLLMILETTGLLLFHSSQYGAKNYFKMASKMAAKIWQ